MSWLLSFCFFVFPRQAHDAHIFLADDFLTYEIKPQAKIQYAVLLIQIYF